MKLIELTQQVGNIILFVKEGEKEKRIVARYSLMVMTTSVSTVEARTQNAYTLLIKK